MSSASAAAAPAAAALLNGCTAPSTPSFFLSSTPLYRVHPLVVFSILDHYQRRNDGQTRVVGTLLGQQVEPGVIEVKQAFPVPHQEEEEAATVEIDYHHSMLALYKQVSPRDVVVGWYSTSGSNETSSAANAAGAAGTPAQPAQPTPEQQNYITSLMHEVYRGQMPAGSGAEPLHLVVDVSMKGGMKVNGFVNQLVRTKQPAPAAAAVTTPAPAAGSAAAVAAAAAAAAAAAPVVTPVLSAFQAVPVQLYAYEEEALGVDALLNGTPDDVERLDAPATLLTEQEALELSVTKLLESLEQVEAHVAAVAAGTTKGDPALALALHQLLAGLPTLGDKETFAATFSTHIQDLLSIVYLAQMTKNQLAIADKANGLI